MRKSLVAIAVFLLAGCTALPTSGPVMVGGPLDAPTDNQVQYLASGPVDGATQQDILDGFLAAGAAAQDDFRTARLFLTDDFAAEWKPLQETVVRGPGTTVSSTGSTALTFTTPVLARVTRGGFYAPEENGSSQSFEFGFEQVGGEWRIAKAPDAVFVTPATFDSAYQPFTVYFYNQARTQFVPDVRYFARAGDPVTEVARAVIDGPSDYLPHAVTAFPSNVTLVASPVDVTEGRALVDVSREMLDAAPDEQQAMLTQMTTTLDAISGVSAVSLTVDRSVLNITGGRTPVAVPEPLVNENALIIRDGEIGFAVGSKVETLGRLGERILALNPTSVSYHDTGVAAVGTAKGVYFVGDSLIQVSDSPSIVEPQIDGSNSVWWVSPTDKSTIRVFAGGRSTAISAPWGSRGVVRALEVSREDARLAVAVDTPSGPRLYVASIGREASGRINSVSGYHRLPIGGSSVVDIAWADSTHIAAITTRNASTYVELASVGGVTTAMGQPTKAVSIVGGNGKSELVIRSAEGYLWQPRAGGWQAIGLSANLLATQH